MQHVSNAGSVSPVSEICNLHGNVMTFRLAGIVPLLFGGFLPSYVTCFQLQINGCRKGNRNKIVRRADKFACFIFFFFSSSQHLAVIHFTLSITSRDFMTHYLFFPKGKPPGMSSTPGP